MKRRYSTRSTTKNSKAAPIVDVKRIRLEKSASAESASPTKSIEKSTGSKKLSSREEEKVKTTIDRLPDKILVNIFEYLNLSTRIRIERVCRRWNYVARNYAWDRTRKIDYLAISDKTIRQNEAGTSSSDDESDTDDDDEFAINRPIVRSLARSLVGRHRLTNDGLCQLLDRGGSRLLTLDLSGYRDTIDYRVLRIIGRRCPRLESLNFTGVLVTNSSLRSLAAGCPRLKSVTFQNCFQESVVDRGLSSLLANCRELTHLNLSENERVRGTCFDELSPTLVHLHLSACYELEDESIKMLARRCPSLETLHLDCCDELSFESLAYAFDRLTKLRVLRMSEFNILEETPNPQSIAALQSLSKLSQLTELYLNHNYAIDDTVVCAVARGCPCLEKLDISGNNQELTDHSLISLGRWAYRSLKRLNFNYLSRITDVGVKALWKCAQLRVLLLHRCDGVGDRSISELAKCCFDLRQLDLSFCRKITNASVTAFYKQRKRFYRRTTEANRFENNGDGSQNEFDGRITLYVAGTMVDTMVRATLLDYRLVRVNHRDVFNYWTDDED